MSSDKLNDNAKSVNNEKKCVLCGPMESIQSGDYMLSEINFKIIYVTRNWVKIRNNLLDLL